MYQVKEKLKNRPAVEFPSNCEWFNSSQPWTSDHLKGRLTLLDFWTYCCVNCMHILPDLEAIEEEFENNEKVLIIGVHRFSRNLNFLVYYRAHDIFSRIFRIRIYKLFTNISQLKKNTNSLLIKESYFFLSFEHLRKPKQIF